MIHIMHIHMIAMTFLIHCILPFVVDDTSNTNMIFFKCHLFILEAERLSEKEGESSLMH